MAFRFLGWWQLWSADWATLQCTVHSWLDSWPVLFGFPWTPQIWSVFVGRFGPSSPAIGGAVRGLRMDFLPVSSALGTCPHRLNSAFLVGSFLAWLPVTKRGPNLARWLGPKVAGFQGSTFAPSVGGNFLSLAVLHLLGQKYWRLNSVSNPVIKSLNCAL